MQTQLLEELSSQCVAFGETTLEKAHKMIYNCFITDLSLSRYPGSPLSIAHVTERTNRASSGVDDRTPFHSWSRVNNIGFS